MVRCINGTYWCDKMGLKMHAYCHQCRNRVQIDIDKDILDIIFPFTWNPIWFSISTLAVFHLPKCIRKTSIFGAFDLIQEASTKMCANDHSSCTSDFNDIITNSADVKWCCRQSKNCKIPEHIKNRFKGRPLLFRFFLNYFLVFRCFWLLQISKQ